MKAAVCDHQVPTGECGCWRVEKHNKAKIQTINTLNTLLHGLKLLLGVDILPNGKPRLLIKALLQITIDTEDATERNNAPTTPN